MINLSIVIPSRSPQWLQKTIDDLLAKAETKIEVIVVLDGYWPDPMVKPDPRVIILHHGTVHNNLGMRASINLGMSIARGKYVMKIDEHCMVEQGYDRKLSADCQDNWVVVPRRYRLDPENWKLIEDGRPPVDHMYLAYPYKKLHDKTSGLYGEEWKEKQRNSSELLEETMSWQGSCWFMTKKHWDWLGPLDDVNYGPFNHEAQEIGNKTWLGGGKVIVNKKTWYAHWHKGKKGKGYGFSNAQYVTFMESKDKSRLYCIDFWIHNRWKERVHDWKWFIEKFMPMPGWPENWEEQLIIDEKLEHTPI